MRRAGHCRTTPPGVANASFETSVPRAQYVSARGVLLETATPRLDSVILAELLALRIIILNLHYAVSTGQPMTPEIMRELIERADRNKFRRVRERLSAADGQPRS